MFVRPLNEAMRPRGFPPAVVSPQAMPARTRFQMWAQFRTHPLLWIAPNEGLQQQAVLPEERGLTSEEQGA